MEAAECPKCQLKACGEGLLGPFAIASRTAWSATKCKISSPMPVIPKHKVLIEPFLIEKFDGRICVIPKLSDWVVFALNVQDNAQGSILGATGCGKHLPALPGRLHFSYVEGLKILGGPAPATELFNIMMYYIGFVGYLNSSYK